MTPSLLANWVLTPTLKARLKSHSLPALCQRGQVSSKLPQRGLKCCCCMSPTLVCFIDPPMQTSKQHSFGGPAHFHLLGRVRWRQFLQQLRVTPNRVAIDHHQRYLRGRCMRHGPPSIMLDPCCIGANHNQVSIMSRLDRTQPVGESNDRGGENGGPGKQTLFREQAGVFRS